MKEHKKYLSIFAALLLAVFAIVCVFGAACNKKDDEEPDEQPPAEEHVHDYTVLNYDENGHWYECSAKDGAKTDLESHTYGSYTVDTVATCTEDGSESAKCSVCGYTDTRVIEAVGHTYPDSEDAENVDWDWTGRTETAVTLTVTCTECGETIVHEDVEYSEVKGEDEETLIGATYTVTIEEEDGYTYESTYDTADDATAEHHHHYGEPTWTWTAVEGEDETGYTVTATFTCESVVNKPADEADVVEKAVVTSEITTPATCVQEGTLTYTATVVLDGVEYTDEKTETIPMTDHTYDPATEKWTWTVDGEDIVSATLSFTCSVCGDVWTETVSDSQIQYDETTEIYTATMTGPDGKEYSDTYEIIEIATEYYFDFSDPETYGWLVEGLTPTDNMYTLATGTSYTTGVVTYTTHSSGNNTINSENAGALFTTGTGSNFAIDLSAFEGYYVSITVKMSTNGNDGDNRTLYVNNDKSTSSGIKSITSSGKEDYQTLEYGEVISAGETLYLTWSANIRIFTVEIKIMDPDDVASEVRSVTLDKTSLSLYVEETDYLTATVEMTIGDFTGTYEWSSSDDTIARVEGSGNGATVIAVSKGTATITVKAGGKEATCTVNVREQSTGDEESITLNYVFDNMSNLTAVITTQENNGEKYSFTENSVTAGEVEGSVLAYTSNKDTPGTQQVTVDGVTYTNYMQMNGTTQSSGNRSFKIDLSSYVGQYSSVTIEVIGTCRLNETTDEDGNVTSTTVTQILISSSSSNASADSALAATSISDVTGNYQPGLSLTYSTTLEERSEFYITCTAHARIYAIYITLGDPIKNDGDTTEEGNTSSESIEVKVDFANPSSDVNSQFEKTVDTDEDGTADQRAESTVTFDEDGILKLIDDQYKTKIESSVFKTGGKTSSYTPTGETSSVVTNYFAIDLTQYEGATVTISVTFTSNKSISETDSEGTIEGYKRSLCLSTVLTKYESLASENVLGEIGTSASTADTQTVTWTGTVTEGMCVYILYSDSLYINSIDITISVDEVD